MKSLFAPSPFLGLRAFVFATLAIISMYVDNRSDYLVPVKQILSTVVAPIQFLVDWPVNMIHWLQSSVTSHQELLAENVELRSQVLMLRMRVLRSLSIEGENAQLRALLSSSTRANGRVLAAQLLAVSSNPLVQKVVLDKGSNDGVYVGQPVLDAYGVMGQVIQVSSWTSEVLLLTAQNSFIPVQNARNNERAILTGSGSSGVLTLVDEPNTVDIKVGDLFVSSGLGLRFPVGYPVGVVTSVVNDPNQTFGVIELRPSAHVNRSRQVLLVWPNMPPLPETLTESLKTVDAMVPSQWQGVTQEPV